jgi:hypothetical protein
MSWSFIPRNRRHVNLDIEPKRAPIFDEVGFTAGRDLNSRDPSSGVLPSSVESTTCIVSFVELPVVDFNDIWHDDQLKKSRESIGTEVAPEGLQIQMNLDTSRKDVGES